MSTTHKTIRCVVCPQGCLLEAYLSSVGAILSITGNTCQRGLDYATSELTHPHRTLTSTVWSKDMKKIPVRTSQAISKELIFPAMEIIHSIRIATPVHRGDILMKDFMEPGVNLIATKDS